jgi:amino acid transporter
VYVRIRREELSGAFDGDIVEGKAFRPGARGHLVATDNVEEAAGSVTRALAHWRNVLLGRPLDNEALGTERLSIFKALPILSSDALSSVAYGPEAGLAVLAAAGAGAFFWNIPIAIAIAILMAVVVVSYRQIIRGYQGGGGSYAVSRANLGTLAGLVAAAAVLVDYVLTVATSIASGVDALVSAAGGLASIKIGIALGFIALIALGNLRGLREAGALFAGPTYLFILAMFLLIAVGLARALTGGAAHPGQFAPIKTQESLTPLLVLTAFASGCSSMTGIEAVSNSVPSFEPPEARHAVRTLTILGGLLIVLFLGIMVLDVVYGAEPRPGGNPTVLSEIAAAVFTGPARAGFYLVQFATLLVLVLAANTSFNGFPRLSAILAQDDFLPHRFGQLGNRLVYSSAIVFLAVAAAILVLTFNGSVDALVNLYALGVFTAFTLAQTAMVRHWWLARDPGWQRGLVVNGVGALATGVVDAVIIFTKAPRGAWVVLVIVPALVLLFMAISRYYAGVRSQLARAAAQPVRLDPGPAVVPVVNVLPPVLTALAYAESLSSEVIALHPSRDPGEADRFRAKWHAVEWPAGRPPPELRMLPSGRRRMRAFLAAVDEMCRLTGSDGVITVVLPEPESTHVFRQFLGRPDLLTLKLGLLRRANAVAASIPAPTPALVKTGSGHHAMVPIANFAAPAQRALAYAVAIATEVTVIHVESRVDKGGDARALRRKFEHWKERLKASGPEVPVKLVVIDSPYRAVVPPVLAYVDAWRRANPDPLCTVVLPELVAHHWWALILSNQRAFWLKAALLSRTTVAVADVTYQLVD